MSTPAARAAGREHVIVVAPPGAQNASDRDPGTFGRPLATLGEAQRRARLDAAKGNRDVTVHLRGGTYRLSEPLRFDAADSGHGGRTVTWRGAPDTTVLSGAQPLTAWTVDDATTGIYKAHVSDFTVTS